MREGSVLYLTTDGFADQNNMKGKKFGSPALRQFLEEIGHKTLKEQNENLSQAFDTHSYGEFQRDDVTVIGIKI